MNKQVSKGFDASIMVVILFVDEPVVVVNVAIAVQVLSCPDLVGIENFIPRVSAVEVLVPVERPVGCVDVSVTVQVSRGFNVPFFPAQVHGVPVVIILTNFAAAIWELRRIDGVDGVNRLINRRCKMVAGCRVVAGMVA